jgi:hypothetical protein
MISTYTKDLSWEKMDHILQISKKKNSTSPESYDNLQ